MHLCKVVIVLVSVSLCVTSQNSYNKQPEENSLWESVKNSVFSSVFSSSQRRTKPENHDDFPPINYNAVTGDAENASVARPEDRASLASEKRTTETTPALSALALLGFLYFLNRMQDVLGVSGKRKKREVDNNNHGKEQLEEYISAIEELVAKVSEVYPTEVSTEEGRSLSDAFNYFRSNYSKSSLEQRAFRVVNFMSSLFSKIPQIFGFGSQDADTSRNDEISDDPDSPKPASEGFWSMFGDRVGLVAKIMDFLDDPQPSRIGRANYFFVNKAPERSDVKDTNAEYAEPMELSDEEKTFLPPSTEKEQHSRRKRFTTDQMNMWYSVEPSGTQNEESLGYSAANNQLLGIVMNLFKQAILS